MMKKLIALLLCAAMVIALTACGSTPAAPKSESPAEPAAEAPAEARVLKRLASGCLAVCREGGRKDEWKHQD